jgi:hypothetical protein
LNSENSSDYKKSVQEFQVRVKNIRVGYVPGVIRHYYHGTKASRNYGERWKILVKHQYSPIKHVTYDKNGILIPTNDCPQELLDDIMSYFGERNEDDIYKDKNIQEMIQKIAQNNDGDDPTEQENIDDDEDDPTNLQQQMGKMLYNVLLAKSRN